MMRYFKYTALLRDGERKELIELAIGIPHDYLIRFGFIRVRDNVAWELGKRLAFDGILDMHMVEVSKEEMFAHTKHVWYAAGKGVENANV